ncbi:MAG: histone deacetylase [Acidimicrobiaceae bacterium]|nr:histone deacetylase [Acidimicrobiaceae bacterium]
MLLITDENCLKHDPGRAHPERPDRLRAALKGVGAVDVELLDEAITPRRATIDELRLVHTQDMIDLVASIAQYGGGRIDADTGMSSESFDSALLAAGSVLTAVEMLTDAEPSDNHINRSAYCVIRPPGHHATVDTSMGFCLFNSVAVAAASLASAGRKVAVVDIDAHHGNGTQDIFYHRDDVLYASIHQYPFYPGTGALTDHGRERGRGFTVNIPVPAGTTGDVALVALDEAIVPSVERFEPDWMVISAGYDGHQADPLANLRYSAADYGDFVRRLLPLASKSIVVLEGGYDLAGVESSSQAVVAALLGIDVKPETIGNESFGMEKVQVAIEHHYRFRAE